MKNKNVPSIRFKGFSEEWEEKELGQVSDKIVEKNTNYQFLETFTNSAEFGIISQRDFFDKVISNFKNLDGYYIVRPNDFVYNPRISTFAPVGPIKRNKLNKTGVMSPLYYVFKPKNIDLSFLEKYFDTNYWHEFMTLNGDSGARSDRFSIKDMELIKMPIPYPSIDEQTHIGNFFQSIDNLITLNQKKLDKLKNLKKASLEKMFPKQGATTPEIRFKGFSGEWEEKRLGEIGSRFDNLRVPITAKNRISGKTPYYGANGIQDYVEGFTHDGEFLLIAEDGASDLINYPIQYVNGRVWVNNHAHVFQAINKFANNIFLKYGLSQVDIKSLLVGGGRAKLNASAMMNIEVILPQNIEEQKEIGSYFYKLEDLISKQQTQLTKLKNIKKACLDKMFVTKDKKQ